MPNQTPARLTAALEGVGEAGMVDPELFQIGNEGGAAVVGFLGLLADMIRGSSAVEFLVLRLVVEEILLSRAAGHGELGDALRLGGVMAEQVLAFQKGRVEQLLRELRPYGSTADAGGWLGEKMAAGDFEHQCWLSA